MSARQAAGMKGGISGEFNKCSHKKMLGERSRPMKMELQKAN